MESVVLGRLVRRSDFQRLYEKGRKFVHPLAVFFFLPSEHGQTRVGFTISKRVGKAVVRNKIKRRLREVFRARRELFPAVDLAVVARAGLAAASFQDYEEAVARFLWWMESRKR